MQTFLDSLWVYDQEKNDFRLFQTIQEWKDQLDVSGAVRYLREHLQRSLINDFNPAYEAYQGEGDKEFFALPRIIFPYITFLGTLLHGKDSSDNAIKYMNEYMGKINSIYDDKQLCDFIYRVYRHGLAHTNMPKVLFDNGKVFGWRIVFDDNQHLNIDKNPRISGKSALLSISPRRLAYEVVSSIDKYIHDLQNGSASLNTFKEGFCSMATASHYLDRGRNKRFVIPACLQQ